MLQQAMMSSARARASSQRALLESQASQMSQKDLLRAAEPAGAGGADRDAATPQTAHAARMQNAATEIREMIGYLFFLTIFTYVTLQDVGFQEQVLFTRSVTEQLQATEIWLEHSHVLKTFHDVATPLELMQWMQGPMLAYGWSANSFDGDDSFPEAAAVPAGSASALNERGLVGGQAYVLGAVRVGQLRVRGESCEVPDAFKPSVTDEWTCYPRFDEDDADTAAFGLDADALFTAGAEPDEPGITTTRLRRSYPPPRFPVLLGNPGTEAGGYAQVRDQLAALNATKYIDRATRLITIDFNVYNPQLDMVCMQQLAFELTAGGGVLPSADVHTLRLWRYATFWDVVRLALESVLLAFVTMYMMREAVVLRAKGLVRYLSSAGTLLHCLNLAFFYIVAALRLMSYFNLPDKVNPLDSDFVELGWAREFLITADRFVAFNCILTIIKVFKYLSFIPRFGMLLKVLDTAANQIAGFSIIVCICVFGCAMAFVVAFSSKLFAFRNLSSTLFSLIRALLGDFDFESMRIAAPLLSPLLFATFVLIVTFVLLNMFIAIISDAFAATKEDLAAEVGLASIGHDVAIYLRSLVFGIPCIGKHIERAYWAAQERINRTGNQLRSLAQVSALRRLSTGFTRGGLPQTQMAAAAESVASDGGVSVAEELEGDAEVGATVVAGPPMFASSRVAPLDVSADEPDSADDDVRSRRSSRASLVLAAPAPVNVTAVVPDELKHKIEELDTLGQKQSVQLAVLSRDVQGLTSQLHRIEALLLSGEGRLRTTPKRPLSASVTRSPRSPADEVRQQQSAMGLPMLHPQTTGPPPTMRGPARAGSGALGAGPPHLTTPVRGGGAGGDEDERVE